MADSDPALKARVERIQRMIETLPSLPVSSIDEVKRRIREAGWACDEITGRTLEINDGRIMRRPASNPTVIKNAFNAGDLDAVIINVAGSTGIDLHASQRFSDKRKRRLIELQASADILRKIQAHGRVNRYDQVEDPEIVSFISGLPVELRLAAIENAKLRRLSANTTSNRDAAILTRGIPDLINPVGDVVCSRYAEVRPELMRRLGFKVEDVQRASTGNLDLEKEGEKLLAQSVKGTKVKKAGERIDAKDGAFRVADAKRTANEILARLIMLPVAQQEKVCNELTAEFHAAVEELEAKGETPLKTYELSGIVHAKERTVFDGAEVENPDSVFQEPLYAVRAALERTGTPIRAEDLMERIQIGEMASGRAQACMDRLRSSMEEILEPFLPAGCLTVADAIQRELGSARPEVTRRKERLERLAAALGDVKPGKQVSFNSDGLRTQGIVTRVEYPERGYEHVPAKYKVEFVVPGDEKTRTMGLEHLLRDPDYGIDPGLEGSDYDKVLNRFENAVNVRYTEVNILTHNIYKAMRLNVEHRLGKLQTYVAEDGTRHRGVVVSKIHRNLKAVPVALNDAEMACEALVDQRADLVASNSMNDKTFSIKPGASSDVVELRLPRENSKMGFVYDHPHIAALLRRVDSAAAKQGPRLVVTTAEARDIVKAFYEAGARFWCTSLLRDWAVDRAREKGLPVEPENRMGMVA